MPQPDQLFSNMQQGQEQAKSILENYILARKGIIDRKQQTDKAQADIENVQSEILARKQLHDESMKRLDHEYEVQQAQIKLLGAQHDVAHLSAANDLRKSILDSSVPTPPQGSFDPNNNFRDRINPNLPQANNTSLPPSIQPNQQSGPFQAPDLLNGTIQNQQFQQLQAPNLPGSFPNQPLTVNGITLQGNEYQTPEQVAAARRPLIEQHLRDMQNEAYATAFGKSAGEGKGEGVPGGKTEQKIAYETPITQQKADKDKADNERATYKENLDNQRLRDKDNADNQIKLILGQMASSRNKPTELDLRNRADEIKYGEGPVLGKGNNDLAAVSILRKSGAREAPLGSLKNVTSLKPLEDFSKQMEDYANDYLADSGPGAILNAGKVISGYPSEQKAAYNRLLLQATNISKGVEGATGRILLPQINAAKEFIANTRITKSQMLTNANKLRELNLNSIEGQLGALSPAQRVDFLDHHGFEKYAALEAQRHKLDTSSSTTQTQSTTSSSGKGLLSDPNWVIKGTQ